MKNAMASGRESHCNLRSRRNRLAARVLFEACEPRLLLSAYVVSTSGNDAEVGTAASPWKTLQHAADVVRAGDNVDVRAGTYTGFNLTSAHSGTAGSPIVFSAQAGVVINAGNTKTGDGINMEGASYITIEGFKITNPTGAITRGGIRAVTNNHVIIRNNTIDHAAEWNIFTGFSDDVLIENNISSNPILQHDIYVSNSGDRPVIRGNILFGSQGSGIHMNGDISQGGDGIISNGLVENNIVYGNGSAGGSGINADGVQNSVFRNNLLYNNQASGISLFKEDGGGSSTGNLVINNTIVVASNGRWAINIINGSTNNTVRNNVLENLNSGRGGISVTSDSMSGFTSDYNVIVNNKFTNGSTVYTLAQWQSATGQDGHSVVTTDGALFVNSAASNYHLLAGSVAVDTGTATNVPLTDADGKSRPSGAGVDIGAYEYNGGTPTPPAPAPTPAASSSTLNLSSNSVVNGQAVTLTTTVTSASGSPTGTVSFMDGSTLLGTKTLNSGSASLSTSGLATGTHSITAVYAGSASYLACTSAAAALTITAAPAPTPTPATSSTTLNLSSNSVVNGQAVTLTTTVSSASGSPTGTVSFMDGSTLLGTKTLSSGSASLATSSLTTGTHSITAVYGSSASFTASTSATAALTVTTAPAPVPSPTPTPTPTGNVFTADGDIGSPALQGAASYDSAVGMYTITGAGKDIWGSTDQFHYDYKNQSGDTVIVARVSSVAKTYGWAKAGVMFRTDTSAGSQFVDVLVTPSNGVAFQWRGAAGGVSSNVAVAGIKAPEWVKLVRSVNSFSGYYSTDGLTWHQVGATTTVNMNPNALAGLAVTSHNTAALTTATFNNVSVLSLTQAAPASTQINLGYNTVGITKDGATYSSGGLDGGGRAYSSALLGTSITTGGLNLTLGAANLNNVLKAGGQTLALSAGTFSKILFLGSGTNGGQTGTFTVNYTDGTQQLVTQGFSDWAKSSGYANETVAKSMAYQNLANGTKFSGTIQLYAYSNSLNVGKTVSSLTLPNNANINILAIALLA